MGFFTESGIGCRRDPLEANVWYVKAADQGEERAKHRLAAIQAASEGANPVSAAKPKKKNDQRASDVKSKPIQLDLIYLFIDGIANFLIEEKSPKSKFLGIF